MEITVIQNCIVKSMELIMFANNQVIIENETQVWIACEVALHLNTAIDWGVQHKSIRIEQNLPY